MESARGLVLVIGILLFLIGLGLLLWQGVYTPYNQTNWWLLFTGAILFILGFFTLLRVTEAL